MVSLSGSEPVVEVPIKGSYAPNMFISVFVVRGRVGDVQPTALVDLGKPAFKLGIAEVEVGWRDHELQVSVTTEKPVYRVREQAKVKVAVRTADGTALPAGSEIAVAAVDEGLLELLPNRSWNVLPAMMGRRGYSVQTATAQMQVIGKRHYGLKALPQGGGGGRQPSRELFDTLLLWQGRVPLDQSGNAAITVPLNDSLTSFRIVAVATGGLDRFGTGSTSIRSTQDLMLLSAVAPIAREGDRFRSEFTVRNTTERAVEATVTAAVAGLDTGLPSQSIRLNSGEAKVVGWDITAPVGVDALRYEVSVSESGGTRDLLRVTQHVIPAVPVRTFQATLLRGDKPIRQPVARPADAVVGRGGVQVTFAPTLTLGLNGVRDWMRDYPFTCMEQRVSRAVALSDKAMWDGIAAALPAYLDSDGLLKYFPLMAQGSDVLTAYALSITHEAGLVIPADVQRKMQEGLRKFIGGSLQRDSELRTADLSIRKLAAVDALALDQRLITPASLLEDTPLEIAVPGGVYRPQNYDEQFRGLVSVRTALAGSLNIPAVRTLQLVGAEPFVRQLRRLGFVGLHEAGDYYGPSLALGSADVSLWEQVNGYRALANSGTWSPMRLTPEASSDAPHRVYSAGAAFLVSNILADRESRSVTGLASIPSVGLNQVYEYHGRAGYSGAGAGRVRPLAGCI